MLLAQLFIYVDYVCFTYVLNVRCVDDKPSELKIDLHCVFLYSNPKISGRTVVSRFDKYPAER